MKKQSVVVLVAASLAVSVPAKLSADAADLIIGGVAGALLYKGISENQKAKRQGQVTRKSTSGGGASASSLNGQYTRAERIQIQSAFRDLGYSIGTVDGVLGRNSRAVIRQFQASLGEPQTGQLTRPQYVTLLSQVPGSQAVFARRELNRDEVFMLQQGLQTLGYYNGRIDGSNGPGTRGAMNAFLARQGLGPASVTPVQGLVMARNAAGLQSPQYLYQEASMQNGVQPFGAQPPAQAGYGAQQPNQFGAPTGQAPVQAFGAPAQQAGQGQFGAAPAPQQAFGAPAAGQQAPLFGTPQQQPVVPQQGTPVNTQQNLFAPAAPQQQAPQPVVPQGGGNTSLFAAGGAAPQQQVVQQAPQSSLDIYSGTAQQVPQTNQVANQTQPAPTGQGGLGTSTSLVSTSGTGN